jgi:uncharacterized membrane protein (DUF106 family)
MTIVVIISFVCIILTAITAIFSILAYARVVGMEKSTHQIAWQNVPEPTQELTEEEEKAEMERKKALMKQFDDMYTGHEDEQV